MNTPTEMIPIEKVALITGAAKRVGAAIAQSLHSLGYRIIIHYNSSHQEAKALVNKLNNIRPKSADCIQADLTCWNATEDLATEAEAMWSRLDALINCASSFYPTALGETTQTQWNDLLGSNVQAPFILSQRLAAALQTTKGSIINIADIYGEKPLKNHTVYCLAKSANRMLTQSLAIELAPAVRVNGIAPGAILWPSHQEAFSPEHIKRIQQTVPLKTPGDTDDICQAVIYLLENAPYVTGQIISVDGGRSLNI